MVSISRVGTPKDNAAMEFFVDFHSINENPADKEGHNYIYFFNE